MKPAHYRGSYHVTSRRLVALANSDPTTRCRRCGLTVAEAIASGFTPNQAKWSAGHVVDGEVGGTLVPEHLACNSSAGAKLANQRRTPTSIDWFGRKSC